MCFIIQSLQQSKMFYNPTSKSQELPILSPHHSIFSLYFQYFKQVSFASHICIIFTTSMQGKQKPEEKVLHVLSDFVNMRFSLLNNKVYLVEKSRKAKDSTPNDPMTPRQVTPTPPKIQEKTSKPKSLLKLDIYGQKEPSHQAKECESSSFQLKFLERLSEQHLLVGNQYQLDLLKIGGVLDGFLDVQHKWSINTQGVVHSLSVQRKFSLIGLASSTRIWVYKYDLKRDQEQPSLVVSCVHEGEEIVEVRFIRNAGVYCIMQSKLQFYRISWVCEKAQLIPALTHKFSFGTKMSIFCVPEAFDNTLNLYYYEKAQNQKFNLWMQSFVTSARVEAPLVGRLIRIYSLEEEVREKIEIFNFNSEICLIQFQNKLIAFKNGFVIDAVSTNIHQPSYFIKYVSSRKTLFHFLDNVIDIYSLAMIERSKPEKFRLLCRDCIEFSHRSSGKLLSILNLGQDRFAFFFETAASRSSSSNPNITYRFAVTQPVNMKAKIDRIYPSPQDISKFTLEELYEKSHIAEKMGLSKRDAFLELWMRSSKSSITDFQILLSTRDFPTIEGQIEHKLKRQSMSVRELLKIYGECLGMLHDRVYNQSCTLQDLKEYSICHFLIAKLEMLRWLLSCGSQQEGTIMVNIKDYYQYKDLSIVPAIVQLVYEYINRPTSAILLKLKAIFKYFRLICKLEYKEILASLIDKCKLKILDILKVLPQLLPFQPAQDDEVSIGLWQPLKQQELDQNIFLSQLMTIDNRERVEDFPKHLWFKRYLYSSHGVIKDVDRKAAAAHLAQKNNPYSIFYMFLCKVYNLNIFNNQLRQLISYVEAKYDLMPAHLHGKLELYLIMFSIFAEVDKSLELYNFLRLRQHELFKLYFQREKAQKGGFILKKIKPLYEQLLVRGKEVFNQGMYEYFSSEESTVSDLKCILSKLNNQKNQFHINSQQLYEVLISAIMQKIKVGSAADTPIDEILVYIENIPFPIHNDSIMANLEYIQEINYQSDTLRAIKVNMTLSEIVKNGERVIQMMVDHEIDRHDMLRIRDYRSLRLHAYKILAEIQCRKSNIYGDRFHNYSLKIFLINVMNNHHMIPLCKQLLADKYLIQEFQIDDAFKESVVMHLYQWRLSLKKDEGKNPYKDHLQFIRHLISLLEIDNSKRKFIQASVRFAQLFTLENYQIQYPLFPTFKYYPALVDVQALLANLSASDLVNVNLRKVFETMLELKKLGEKEMNASISVQGYQSNLKLELYEIYLIRLVEVRELKLALEVVANILDIPNEFQQFNIVYPVLIMERTFQEVLQGTAALLNRVISFSFRRPRELCLLLSQIYNNRYSNVELDNLLEDYLEEKRHLLEFTPSNPIFQPWMRKQAESSKRNEILEICLARILRVNEVYRKNNSMQVVFRLMSHQPLAMAKWIWCKGSGINMKTLRSFVSYMSIELLFDADAILKATIDALQVLSFKYTNNVFFSEILKFKEKLSLRALKDRQSMVNQASQSKSIKLINESIQLLQHKREAVRGDAISVFKEKQSLDYDYFLKDPKVYMQRQVSEYVYSDKDDAYEDNNDELSIKSKWRTKLQSINAHSDHHTTRIYEQIPLPTAVRPRKNSQYFPQLLDLQQNFIPEKILKASLSERDLPKSNFSRFPDQVQQILEDQGENMNSMVLIKYESSKQQRSSSNKDLLNKIEDCSSDAINEDDMSQKQRQDFQQFSFKIQVKEENHVDPEKLVNDLLDTVQGESGVFDLSQLRTEARKKGFREYLQKVLEKLYDHSRANFAKSMRLFLVIVDDYKQIEGLNKEAVGIFTRLQLYRGLSDLGFDFRQVLPVKMLFRHNLQEFYENFQSGVMDGANSLDIFQRFKFTLQVVGKEWKDRLAVASILEKVEKVQQLKEKIQNSTFAKGEEQKIFKELEMYQFKIQRLVEEDDKVISRLMRVCQDLQRKDEHSKGMGQVLRMSLSAIRSQMNNS